MATTFGHLLRPNFNGDYPATPKVLPERARMSLKLRLDDDGVPLCKSCGLCERSCPDRAIHIVSSKREDGPGRVLERFEVDMGLCMYCGLCVEMCPSAGLEPSGDFEVATARKEDTHRVLWPSASTPSDARRARGDSDDVTAEAVTT